MPVFLRAAGLLVLLPLLQSCQGLETVPETGRQRPSLQYSEDQMAQLGADAYKTALEGQTEITDTPEAELVARVGKRIADATGKSYEWEFKLIEDKNTVNAFCLPGGKIVVFSGMLDIANGEDGLAVVLSHEIAHATLQHGNERMSQPAIKKLIGLPVSLVTDLWAAIEPNSRRVVMDSLGLGCIIGHILPYSQIHESEADEVGLSYMKAAGYDLNEAPDFWRRMARATPQTVSDSISTHPGAEERAKRIEQLIRENKVKAPKKL